MIFLTGDMHGDVSRFRAVAKAGIRKNDTLIVCGDFGFLWNGSEAERRQLRAIGKKRYRVLFVDGCNENHKLLSEYPEVELLGGKARQISGNLYALGRGEVYTIDDKKVFAFGGGNPLERYAGNYDDALLLPTENEIEHARARLADCGNQVDLIVTHDAPTKLRQFIDMDTLDDMTHLHAFFEEISRSVKFRQWYIGKYHLNKKIPTHYQLLFTLVCKFDKAVQATAL